MKHIIAGGCSFTEDAIGGTPPTKENPWGGNSYTHNPNTIIKSWAGYVAKELNSSSFVNLATASRGNYHTYLTLLHILTDNRYLYNNKNTLVLFNISDLGRLDIPVDDLTATSWHTWGDIIPFGFLHDPKNIYKLMQQEQVETISLFAIRSLIDFLKINNYQYRFTLMYDYLKDQRVNDLVADNKNLVLTPNNGMAEYCVANDLCISDDDNHPNVEGHASIGKIVLNTLS